MNETPKAAAGGENQPRQAGIVNCNMRMARGEQRCDAKRELACRKKRLPSAET